MATKFLLLVLLCALFCTFNARRLEMEKGRTAADLDQKFWHHFPRYGGGGVGFGHIPGAGLGGGAGGSGGSVDSGFGGHRGGGGGGDVSGITTVSAGVGGVVP